MSSNIPSISEDLIETWISHRSRTGSEGWHRTWQDPEWSSRLPLLIICGVVSGIGGWGLNGARKVDQERGFFEISPFLLVAG